MIKMCGKSLLLVCLIVFLICALPVWSNGQGGTSSILERLTSLEKNVKNLDQNKADKNHSHPLPDHTHQELVNQIADLQRQINELTRKLAEKDCIEASASYDELGLPQDPFLGEVCNNRLAEIFRHLYNWGHAKGYKAVFSNFHTWPGADGKHRLGLHIIK